MSSIQSLGVGSGLDIKSIVSELVSAEKTPAANKLDAEEKSINDQISAYGNLKSKLSDIQAKLSALKSTATFQQRSVSVAASTTGATVATASAATTAIGGNYTLATTALAQAHTLYTSGGNAPFTSLNDTIGTGTLTVSFGTTVHTEPDNYVSFTNNSNSLSTQTITVNSTNNTLAGFRDYINAGNFGFTASTLYNGTNYILVLTSSLTGAKNSMNISVAEAPGNGDGNDLDDIGLSRLSFRQAGGGTQLIQSKAAQDATFSINNIPFTRDSNRVTDAIDGVTLTLKSTNPNDAVQISVARDTSNIETRVKDFVTAFNAFKDQLNQYTDYDADTKKGGIFLGNATISNIHRLVSEAIIQQVTYLTGNYVALTDLGINSDAQDGTLSLNTTKLAAALAANPDQVSRVFSVTAAASNAGVAYAGSTSATLPGSNYAVNVTRLATQGNLVSHPVAGPFPGFIINDTNDNFTISVDGISSASIGLTQTSYNTGADLATEIQNKINLDTSLRASNKSVQVNYANNRLTITSNSYGANSAIALTAVDINSQNTVGFATNLNGTSGVDVAGTINGLAATGSGRQLLSTTGNSIGLQLTITAAQTGSLGTVNFTRGSAESFDNLITRLTGTSGIISQQTSAFSTRLAGIRNRRDQLKLRTDKFESRLLTQFNAMDTLVASLRSQSNFLTQAFASSSSNHSH